MKHLGKISPADEIIASGPDAGILEVIACSFPPETTVDLSCPEFTATCPVTGQPDYGTIEISYRPGRWIVESKSLKLYLMSYRMEKIFHESCVVNIATDFMQIVRPKQLTVTGIFNPRGGIKIRPQVCFNNG